MASLETAQWHAPVGDLPEMILGNLGGPGEPAKPRWLGERHAAAGLVGLWISALPDPAIECARDGESSTQYRDS
jgi:hypothetical protein